MLDQMRRFGARLLALALALDAFLDEDRPPAGLEGTGG